ncbi:hypothetical protein BDW66DRAFT_131112 [Aspergillus desertorum]
MRRSPLSDRHCIYPVILALFGYRCLQASGRHVVFVFTVLELISLGATERLQVHAVDSGDAGDKEGYSKILPILIC